MRQKDDKRILVVGATGRVGQRVMRLLQNNVAYHVVGTSSHPTAESPLIKLDLHDNFESIRQVVAQFDIVFLQLDHVEKIFYKWT
ncbi:Semialdehyde dehydrogenase, NAD binding domain [Weissella viridescens]|uniref:Semialdehyde dehydrogenase, NAD binding domain n=1 Tax=Weissella viridescens TaxID=1629 RepID=A0A380P1Q2_WEIVI|nr:Semialdehyde dehydrogenase, NAD binding domain [Weissella viridescens]